MTPSARTRPNSPLAPALLTLAALLLALASVGCTGGREINPSFPLSTSDARDDLRAMRANPAPAQRPVVVIGGLLDPGIESAALASRLRRLLSPECQVISITPFGVGTMDEFRERIIARVEEAFPDDDPARTTPVDVVGYSLGGVGAQDAAIPREGTPALSIVRLFLIASPNQGTPAADPPTLDERIVAIRPDSPFIARLRDAAPHAPYEVWSYVRLGDTVVPPASASFAGRPPHWVSDLALDFPHADAAKDPRILADIARRLRSEPAHAALPPAPLPPAALPPAPLPEAHAPTEPSR